MNGSEFGRLLVAWDKLSSNGIGIMPSAIFGRLGRLKQGQASPTHISVVPGHRLAWLVGADGLMDCATKPLWQVGLRMGKSVRTLNESLDSGESWYLLVCSAPEAVLATWDNLRDLVLARIPEATERVQRHWSLVRSTPMGELLGPRFERWRESRPPEHPDHVTDAAFLNSSDSAELLRGWLWHSFGINDSFAGDGYCRDECGRRTYREFLCLNRPLRSDDVVIPIELAGRGVTSEQAPSEVSIINGLNEQ